jgi:hypothetical protein
MFSLTMKRAGLATVAVFALCAFASVTSASAATQHWATSAQVPYGSPQSYSGKSAGTFVFTAEFSGAQMVFTCSGLSNSGKVENPSGGGAGTLTAETFKITGCGTNFPNCTLNEQSLTFSALRGTAQSSGEDKVKYEPAGGEGSTLAVLKIVGAGCPLTGEHPIRGDFFAQPVSGQPGEYFIEESDFSMEGDSLTVVGLIMLESESKEAVVLSSNGSPGAPHWYLGSDQWSTLSAGKLVSFSTNGPLSLKLQGEEFGAPFEFNCNGTGNNLEGTVENPSGGGAGTASATLNLNECSVSPLLAKVGCALSVPIHSAKISGTTTEVGEPKLPAVGLSTPSEGEFATFQLTGKNCPVRGSYPLEGILAPTSEGDGYFNPSGSELFLWGEPFVASGHFALKTDSGQLLRLQS